jgi:hypothetical protein
MHKHWRPLFASTTLLAAALCLSSLGCVNEYDFDRPDYERGTLGEELHAIWIKDARRAPDKAEPKSAMLERRRGDFVVAVDTIAPPETLDEVDSFFRDLMALVDDGLVPGLSRKIGVLLQTAAGDDQLLDALAIENRPHPEDFLSPVNGKNFIGHLMGFERLPKLATTTTSVLLSADGLDRQGHSTTGESRALFELLVALKMSLSDTDRTPATDSLAYSMQQVLAEEDERFEPAQVASPNYAVVYDRRGFPKVKQTSTGLPAPFVDSDGDGLADVDDKGRFILSAGEAKRVPAFRTSPDPQALLNRDNYGRGTTAGGDFVFEYVDLNRTGLHFVTRQLGELTNRGLLWKMVDISPALLGPREVKQDVRGPYTGYSADNPVTDLAYALLHILDIATLDEAMATLADFLDRHSSELAAVLFSLDEASDLMAAHPGAQMSDEQTIAHDLLPVLEQISADPDLWRDFFWALRQPITRHTGEPMATLLKHKDQNPSVPQLDGPYDSCFQRCKANHASFEALDESNPRSCAERYQPQQALARYQCVRNCPQSEIFSEPMDFDAPESVDNRSMLQRLFHLLRDTAGTPYGLQIVEPDYLSSVPPIVHLEGSAEAFVRSIGSSLDLADYVPENADFDWVPEGASTIANVLSTLSPLFGTGLDRQATPDQITRLFNQTELAAEVPFIGEVRIDPPVCKDDYVMANHHADILYASEASGLIDAMGPLACAFSMHDQEALLAELFVIVHDHYASRSNLYRTAGGDLSPMKAADLVSYEPALLDIMEQGKLFDALVELSEALDGFKSGSQDDLVEHLRVIVYNAARTDDGFVDRQGQAMINLADGRTVRDVSRMHVMMEAADQMAERVESDPAAEAALEDLTGAAFEVMLDTQWPDGERASFVDEGGVALLSRLLAHLADRAAELRADGQLSQWLTDEQLEDVEAMWDSRALPALVDLSTELAAGGPEHRQLTDDLTEHLLGSPQGRDQAAMAAYVVLVYTLQQDVWVPLTHFVADVVDPERDWGTDAYAKLPLVSHVLHVLHDSVELDPEGRGLDMFERGFSNRPDESVPFASVFSVVADYFRVDPDSTEPFDADDYRHVFTEFAQWLGDDVHGLEQIYDIVGRRAQ